MGIGGIGVSGIAAILCQQGYTISGCDSSSNSKILENLSNIGCKIYFGHDVNHIKDVDVLVYSSALDKNHFEISAAVKKGIPVVPRAMMLAELMRMKYSIAVAGAHGKTTTTSMISHILTEAKLDPTIVIGGVLKNISTHAKLGHGDLLIAEADESDRSFLYLNPSMAIVTNVDSEHLDTYKDLNDVKNSFKNFLERLPFYGKAFVCIDDKNTRDMLPVTNVRTIKYGLSKEANICGEVLELEPTSSIFKVYIDGLFDVSLPNRIVNLGSIKINMPGEHNILNALASISIALELEIPFHVIKSALESFSGVERRFEFKGFFKRADIFDDYGHHPTEIEKTLLIARNRAKKRLHVAFQPHRYTRTYRLWKDFVSVFANANIDSLIFMDIYPASEEPIPGITSDKLLQDISRVCPGIKAYYCSSYEEVEKYARDIIKEEDLFLTIGAGKINCVCKWLIESENNIVKQTNY